MPPRIDRYAFGTITIDGTTYRSDVVVLPDRVVSDWWRHESHALAVEDLSDILAEPPDVLVVGTGASGLMRVSGSTLAALEARGVEVVVEPTEKAVRTYNRLAGERQAAACLHLTC